MLDSAPLATSAGVLPGDGAPGCDLWSYVDLEPRTSSLSEKLTRFWPASAGRWPASTVRQRPSSSAGGCCDRHSVGHSGALATRGPRRPS